MNAPELRKLTDWLIDGARSAPTPVALLTQTCEGLVAAGVPLWRVGAFVKTLHPDLFGRSFIWRKGAEVVVNAADFDFEQTQEFIQSPLAIVYDSGREVRYRLDDPDSKRFPFFDDMRAEGVTDYIALPLLFTDGSTHVSSWTTKAPGGIHRRATGRLKVDPVAVCAARRDFRAAPHRLDAARYLCRQSRRRADHGRPNSARPR